MTGGRKPMGAATRRAVTRIFGAADSLPERSKASKVLTTVACRLQLFVYELERARFEHFGLGIEQLLERLHEHCQLLGVASVQGGGIQSGYALLSELLELLQELEASVLLLPGQLGGDARYKPALDELQALLANVSYYRSECEETKRRMEAALSELFQGCPARVLDQGTAQATSSEGSKTPATATAQGTPTAVAGAARSSSHCSDNASSSSRSGDKCYAAMGTVSAEHGGAGADVAVLQRVRQVIFELDLDVEMAEGAKDLDAELLLLRDQMEQELRQQLRQQLLLLHKEQSQPQQPHLELDDPDPQLHKVEQSTLLRSGARKRREGPGDHGAVAGAYESPRAPPLSPSASSPTTTPHGTAASRLYAARHVSRRLAAQHLARLKEQQRQLRLQNAVLVAAAGAVTAPCSPSNRAVSGDGLGTASGAGGPSGKGVEEDSGDDFTVQPAARRRRMAVTEEESTGTDVALGNTVPTAAAAAAAGSGTSAEAKPLKSPKVKATIGAKTAAGAAEEHSRKETAVTVSDQATPSEVEGRDRADTPCTSKEASATKPASRPLGPMCTGNAETDSNLRANAVDSGDGLPCPERSCASASDSDYATAAAPGVSCGGLSEDFDRSPGSLPKGFVTWCSGGGSVTTSDSGVSSDGSLGALQQRPREASVMALRKLNRVTTLAGMWEAGRPVAHQGTAEASTASGDSRHASGSSISGSASDYEDRSDGCASDTGSGGCELPARPAARRRAAPAATILPGLDKGAASNSPFAMLALQRGPMKAPQRTLLGRLLASPLEHEPTLDDVPASPAVSVQGHDGIEVNLLPQSPTVAAGIAQPGCLRMRGAGAAAAAAAAAPAPLPLPDASVHLRAVGLPGCFVPQWSPPAGAFGIPAAVHPGAGLWLAGGGGGNGGLNGGEGECSGGSGGANGGGSGGGGTELLDFGPDVPTLDLHRDITGWGPCLGRGAFGAVYKALFRNKPAAIKVLHGGALDVRDMRALRMEISLLCRLRHHPNIITVYGAAAAPPDRIALVTELMDCDLYDYIHRRRQNCVPMDEVLSIARAIASGLSELHPAIVHRDLKPANVLLRHSAPSQGGPGAAATQQLDRRLTVKIADFGLARHKRSQYLSTRDRDAGTLKYMAPECIASGIVGGGGGGGGGGRGGGSCKARREGGDADCSSRSASSGSDAAGSGSGTSCGGLTEKCDIYSFGVLLYELITGREPWEGCHPLYAMCQVQSGVTLQLPDDPTRSPPALRALVQRCWSYQHHKRPNSRELLQELDGIIAERQLHLTEEQHGSGGGGPAVQP